MINEGNISNKDRFERQISNIIKSYSAKTDMKDCTFEKTSRGNWRVDRDGKRICVISKFVLTDEMAAELNIKIEPDKA